MVNVENVLVFAGPARERLADDFLHVRFPSHFVFPLKNHANHRKGPKLASQSALSLSTLV